MPRFSAKILFQFAFDEDTERSICQTEMRIISFDADSTADAYEKSLLRGRQAEYEYINNDGILCRFVLVGILQLIHLGVECEADEVWYDTPRMRNPLLRRASLIPDMHDLSAFKNDSKQE